MGVNKGAGTLYHLSFLTMADVAAIVCGIYQYQESVHNGLTVSMPIITRDSNNICHRVGGQSDMKSFAVGGQFYHNWAHCGIEVVPVVEGEVRPIYK